MSIHSSSIIHSSSKIDESVEIGPFCIIGEDVEIKKGSKLLSHVVLKGPTTIGENNTIYQFATIGDDTPDKKYKGETALLVFQNLTRFYFEFKDIKKGVFQNASFANAPFPNYHFPMGITVTSGYSLLGFVIRILHLIRSHS